VEFTSGLCLIQESNMINHYNSEYIELVRLRYYQHQINEMLKAGQFNQIPIHLAFGHEAAAIGMDLTLKERDVLCLSHRNAAYNLARFKSLNLVLKSYTMDHEPGEMPNMASMNLANQSLNIPYTSSILGNNMAVAAGIAMNRNISKLPGIVFVVAGDGAIEEGIFWETMIFSRSHNLGLVIVIENDNCSMSSTIEERRCQINLSLICEGLGIGYRELDGASLAAVKSGLNWAREFASNGNVAIVEMHLETFCQHAGPTPGWPTDPLRISLEDGLILGDSLRDPLVQLRLNVGTEIYEALEKIVIEAPIQ
jgi:pyruvate dehydrogenase E1 component alpha subunit